ncbi:MAG: adenylosuccinate lyase [bacterium]|nr:adenylosuccinate lyase [bacterium]MDT8366316.1 adenylosuccinate lyase [bacterium]
MIPRYTRPEMAAIWEPENRFRIWLDVEIAACEAWNKLGRIPDDALAIIKERADFDIDRIDEIEVEVKHDVIAFLTSVSEKVGPESRYIHMGMTSSDVLDTAFGVQLVQAADLIFQDIEEARTAVREKALKHRDTVMMGRSHGMHAEPTTFGLKMAIWYEELGRSMDRVRRARDAVAVGKLSGAVGTYSNIPPEVEAHVCASLDLVPARVATQVIQRDRHAEYMTALALTASGIEKFAVEIRHLMRTEVGEVQEAFTKGQKGSSAMPHKKNPILSENLTGLARLIRGYSLSAMENIPLWHERDISHSSVERVIFPDATMVMDFMLHRFTSMVETLLVNEERMSKNMELSGGTTFSQTLLLALVDASMAREEAYAIVQRNAHKAMDSGRAFSDLVKEDPDVGKVLDPAAVDSVFDPAAMLKRTGIIFDRVFGEKL